MDRSKGEELDPISYTNVAIPCFKEFYTNDTLITEENSEKYYFTNLILDANAWVALVPYLSDGISDFELYLDGVSIGRGDHIYIKEGCHYLLARVETSDPYADWRLRIYNALVEDVLTVDNEINAFMGLASFYHNTTKNTAANAPQINELLYHDID